MMSSHFDIGSTSKILNLFFLRFNEWSGSENLACEVRAEVQVFRRELHTHIHLN